MWLICRKTFICMCNSKYFFACSLSSYICAYLLSSKGESEVYCEHCTRWAACSHHTHMSTHRLLSHSPPGTHADKTLNHVTAEQTHQTEWEMVSKGTEDQYMVEELAVLGGPSNLHHSWCNDCHLIVPNARIHTKCTTHTLKGRGITSCLKRGRKRVFIWKGRQFDSVPMA